jgi:hypothetical protein
MEEREGTWRVQLDGRAEELEQLRLSWPEFNLPDYEIEKANQKSGNKEHDVYYFKVSSSSPLAQLTDFSALREQVEKILLAVKPFSIIRGYDGSQSIKIGIAVLKTGEDWQSVSVYPPTPTGTSKAVPPKVTVTDSDGLVKEKQPRNSYLNHLDDWINDPTVLTALRYFDKATTWVNLNKVYETIKLAVDGNLNLSHSIIIRNKWATKSELKAFTHIANQEDALLGASGEGRHSRDYAQRQQKGVFKGRIMSLAEGKRLTAHLLNMWLESK